MILTGIIVAARDRCSLLPAIEQSRLIQDYQWHPLLVHTYDAEDRDYRRCND